MKQRSMKLFVAYDIMICRYNIFVEQYKQLLDHRIKYEYQGCNTFVDGEDTSTTARGICNHWRIK